MFDTHDNIINSIPVSLWAPVYNWNFISLCMCMAIVILTAKRTFFQISPITYAKGWVHGLFTLSYLIIGFFAAIPKTYLVGSTFLQRVSVGIIASGLSLAVYHGLFKRLAQAIGVKDSALSDPDDKPPAEAPNAP